MQKSILKNAGPEKATTGGEPNSICREFLFADGNRAIMIDRRMVGFVCEWSVDTTKTLVGFKSQVKPVPLDVGYTEFTTWWMAKE